MTAKQIEKALTKNALIQAARDETADRTSNTFGRSAILSIDPKTGSMRMKAATGKASDMASFKTVDQIRTEKLLKSDSALVRASIAANQKFLEMGSYKNVTAKISREKQKLDSKYAGKLPQLSRIEASRNAAFTKVGLEDERLVGQKAIYGNKYGKAAMDLGTSSYDSLNMHPVSAAATVAGIYASGVIGGVLIEGALGAGAAGAGAIALKTSSKAVKTGAKLVSEYAPSAVRGGLGLGILYQGGKVVASGDAANTVNFVASLAVGGLGYAKGAKLVKDPISILPGVKKIKVQIPSTGASNDVANVPIGTSLVVRGKPVLSYSKEGGFVKGVAKIPSSKVKGLEIQAFDELGTKSFERSLADLVNANDVAKYRAGKAMTDAVYRQKSPLSTPKEYQINSAGIPVEFRPIVKNIVKSYPGVLKVYKIKAFGSSVMKQ
jgi:hypothetical protein